MKFKNKKQNSHKKAYQKLISLLVASLLVCLFVVPGYMGEARDSFVAEYVQTVYDQSNGIGSNEVKCIYQSSSGYVWVGTDTGLYRSNGTDFQSINLWDTDRTDVYSINCITQDTEGRVWIGTDNYGLFYIEKGETYHLQDEYYDGIKSIYDVCELENGQIYVSATNGLYRIDEDENGKIFLEQHPDSRAMGSRLRNIVSYGGNIWLQHGDNEIYILDEEQLIDIVDVSDASSDNIQSMEVINDRVYVGTSGNEVVAYKSKNIHTTLTSSVYGINAITADSSDRIWICADNGVGFFTDNDNFHKLNELSIDNYVTDMMVDYEGNYWFTSKKMGVLYLSRSKFSDFNLKTGMEETIVNCVYVDGDVRYIGADDGLHIYDGDNNSVENDLTNLLDGTGVRYICQDMLGNMWIATARKYGVVKVSSDGSISTIGKGEGLPSWSAEYILQLDDGSIAVATDGGLAIIDKNNNITKKYDSDYGFSDIYINCMYQDDDGRLFIGTDGNGIIALNMENDSMTTYTTADGLNSDVVTAFTESDEGLFIGTDNGLCFYNDTFRGLSAIDYSNAIYDVVLGDDLVWIIGSKGIVSAEVDELLGNQSISGRYFDKNDGLSKNLNTTGKSTIDANGKLYICCDTGIYTLNTLSIPYNTTAPKLSVIQVEIDGEEYEFDDLADGVVVESDTSRIAIKFAVFSYANRENIQVQYCLNGFDDTPTVINGTDSMEAVYTNLDGGTYEFTLSAVNGDGEAVSNSVSFVIEKEKSLFEKPVARVIILLIILLGIGLTVYGAFKVKKLIKIKNFALEKLSKEHEEAVKSSSAKNDYLANMSNEIKTPINVMMVKAEELLNLMGQDETYRDEVEAIYNTGSGILKKVDDIILLAKIEAGRVEVTKQPYSLSGVMYELAEFAAEKIGDKPIKFFVEIGEELNDNIAGDEEKIKDILKRLLDNAVKFTREGSVTLAVDCYEYTDKNHQDMINLVFTVSDTGQGIAEERLEDIFQIYNIDDNRKSGFNAGNGIGLAIAKGYTDLLDGELQADSVYGGGSTFTFSLNQMTVEKNARSRMIARIDEMVSKEDADKLWLPEVNLLIVDDDAQSLEITQKQLAKFEMKIDIASSGISAIDMIMNNSYDVVFMALSLPIMNGTEAMREIRELEGFDTLPIISMDTNAIDKNRDSLLEAGFTDTLVKPIDMRRAAAILKDCLPQSKIHERADSISEYIKGSRYSDGLVKLKEFVDVENALEKIGGSIDVFNRLVMTYYKQNSDASQEITGKFEKNIRSIKNRVHNVKTGSNNIGAYKLSQEASRIEAAINIGNNDYAKDNLNSFLEHFKENLAAIGEYVDYVNEVSGITDEEYSERLSKKDASDKTQGAAAVDINILEDIKYAALDGDFQMVLDYFSILQGIEYTGEDKDFIDVLEDAVLNENAADIDQLVTTYIDLTQPLDE